MKIKIDFVTNSSSSSFIVVWPHKIKSERDVSEFIKRNDFQPIIFKDASFQNPKKLSACLEKITEVINSGYIDGTTQFLDYETDFCKREGITSDELWGSLKLRKKYLKEYELLSKAEAKKIAEEFINQTGDGYVYYFNYDDNESEITADLEHQNNWGGLPTIRVSHH